MNPLTQAVEQVPAERWREWSEHNGALVIDVREPAEWALGTLPGAHRIQLMALPQHLEELDPETPVLMVCRSGNRSHMAARFLTANGYTAANLAGGMKALGMAQ